MKTIMKLCDIEGRDELQKSSPSGDHDIGAFLICASIGGRINFESAKKYWKREVTLNCASYILVGVRRGLWSERRDVVSHKERDAIHAVL